MKLMAKCEVYFGGKTHHAGDTFEANDQWARILIGIGKARQDGVPPPAPPPPQPLQTAALQPEQPPPKPMSTATAELVAPKRRSYKRRDMRAED